MRRNKKTIRLTEQTLNRIVRDCVNEAWYNNGRDFGRAVRNGAMAGAATLAMTGAALKGCDNQFKYEDSLNQQAREMNTPARYEEFCKKNHLDPDSENSRRTYNQWVDQTNESRMRRRTKRLTESQLHCIIKESVKQVLSELDWKTYANAANKRQAQGKYANADQLRNQMVKSFNDKYATSDSEYSTYNGIDTTKTASFQMDNGSMGDQGALKFRSQISQSNGNYPQYINRNYRTGLENDIYNQLPQQGQWHGQNGMTDADKKAKQQPSWSSKVRDKAMQGVNDVDRYQNGQAKYVKGQGWK